jgi:hypothetical protein
VPVRDREVRIFCCPRRQKGASGARPNFGYILFDVDGPIDMTRTRIA